MSRFKDKLIKIIKDVNGRFDDYSVLPKIRQILLYWGYDLVESYFIIISFFNKFFSYKNDSWLV